jgi:hypothetical protein
MMAMVVRWRWWRRILFLCGCSQGKLTLRLWDIFSCQPPTTLPSLDWLLKLMTLERIFYIHAIGEFLHILRPLYWSRETSKWRSNATLSTTSSHHQQSYSIWKAWFMSLWMDLISDKLLLYTNSISMNCIPSEHTARDLVIQQEKKVEIGLLL